MEEKHVSLFYKQDKSDKEYHVHLTPKGKGYIVSIEYGRRGSSLTSSTKTPVPVDLDKAVGIFTTQVHAKRLKGYTEGAGEKPYVGSDKENKITGILPQLLNNIEEEDLDDYFDDAGYCLQEKKDGKRILVRVTSGGTLVEAINRKGLLVGLSAEVEGAAKKLDADCIIDGEMIGDVFWVFDLLQWGHEDLRSSGYSDRWSRLVQYAFPGDDGSPIQLVPVAFTSAQKRKLFKKIETNGGEGVVFKRLSAPYKVGRPNSGGDQLKFKFYKTCTAQVSGHHEKGKRSVYIQMLNDETLEDVGKVTILPNFPVPTIGTLVEIKYLYRHVHGALYQPVYLGERDDLDKPDQTSTLKVKEGIDEDES